MEAGLGRQRHRRASLKGDLFQEHLRHLLRCPGTHIEKFHPALPEDTLIVLPQPLGGDGSHLLRLSQPGNAKGIGGAHIFQQAAHGIHLLVIPITFNGGDEIFLFAVHIAAEEASLLHRGTKQQLPEEVRHGFQHLVAGQGEALVHKAAVQAGGLVVAHPAHQGADCRPVQVVQRQGNGTQAGMLPGSPQQHRRQQGVHGCLGFRHGAHQLHTQAALLESPVLHAAEGDPRPEGKGLNHSILLVKFIERDRPRCSLGDIAPGWCRFVVPHSETVGAANLATRAAQNHWGLPFSRWSLPLLIRPLLYTKPRRGTSPTPGFHLNFI